MTAKKANNLMSSISKVITTVASALIIAISLWGVGVISTASEQAESNKSDINQVKEDIADLQQCNKDVQESIKNVEKKVTDLDKNVTSQMAEQRIMLRMLLQKEGISLDSN